MPATRVPPATLVASNLCYEIGGRAVLSDVSVTVGPSTRLGVIGPNGAGKSTLLRVLAGLAQPGSGCVELTPASATVGYLAQEPERRTGETVRAYLHRATGVARAEADLRREAEALARAEEKADDVYSVALERWQRLGADDIDARVDAALEEMKLPGSLGEEATTALSGGQAAKMALAAIELSRFDITLLDEPTNDLDFDGLSRLERFVARQAGGTVIVSHDRAFLDSSISSVLELDEHDHTARLYRGGWAAYLDERATARRHAEEVYADYATKRRALLDRARRERQWAVTGVGRESRKQRDNDKVQRDFRLNRTEQLASRARRTERALARLSSVDKPWESWDLRFAIAEAPRAGAVVARLGHAVIERGSFRLGPLDLEIAWGERIALSGPNGSGKTSLVEAVLGRLPLCSGTSWTGPSVVVGELDQRRRAYQGREDLLSAFIGQSGLGTSEARSLLAKFGLGPDHVMRPTASLSPGERTRAELAGFQARGVNFLVLDEPTNHLDLPAVEQLEEALASYSGTLLVVSHDRRFLESVDVDRTLELGPVAPGRTAFRGAPGLPRPLGAP